MRAGRRLTIGQAHLHRHRGRLLGPYRHSRAHTLSQCQVRQALDRQYKGLLLLGRVHDVDAVDVLNLPALDQARHRCAIADDVYLERRAQPQARTQRHTGKRQHRGIDEHARSFHALHDLALKPSPFGRIAEQAPNILAQVEEATRRINKLLGDENQERVTQALGQIAQAAGSINTLTQRVDTVVQTRLDPALAALPTLATDARKTMQSLQTAGNSVTAMANDIRTTTQRLSAEGGAIDQLNHGAQVMAAAADNFSRSTLPSINRAADETGRAVRQMGLAASAVSDNPQLFIYGSGRLPPGPGEPGFAPPLAHP